MMHKNACSEKVVLFFLKKTYTIINKCITFVASRDVVLQELCLYLYGKFMIYVRNHTMNVKSL